MTAPHPTRRRVRGAAVAVVLLVATLVLSGCAVVDRLTGPRAKPTPSAAPPRTSAAPTSTPTPAPTPSGDGSATGTATPGATSTPAPARSTSPIPPVIPDGFRPPPPGEGMARYTDQQVDWQPCGSRLECARVAVPLDYDDPDTQAITLAVKRFRGGVNVRGSLFLNPGGPGGSGLGMVENYSQTFDGQYDVVGWDPRGVGSSTPVRCMNGADLDAFYALDSTPDDQAERDALLAGTRAYTESCLALSGRLLEHVSTVETVRDLDLLRGLVGDAKLNFLGFSYGTELGATYAQLFGGNVGRMVLDSAVNITDDDSIIQAQGFDRALGNFATWCGQGNCRWGSRDETIAAVRALWDELDTAPLLVGDRQLTQSLAVIGTLAPLYQDESVWPYLRDGLSRAMQGDGRELLRFADLYNERNDQGTYGGLLPSFNAIRCLDEPDGGLAGAERDAQQAARLAPMFGAYSGADVICPLWPVAPRRPIGTITAPDAPPILVVGTTGDSATPYEYARSMADQLVSGTLLTYDGEGHGAFGGSSQCINQAVLGFLSSGRPPADGTVCT